MAVKKLQFLIKRSCSKRPLNFYSGLKRNIKKAPLILLFTLISIASSGEGSINVLFLSSFEKGIPASRSLEKGLSKTFKTNRQKENLYFEYMDSQKLQLKSYGFYRDYLKGKYSNIDFDYIVCWGFDAIDLLTSHRDIFPRTRRVLLEGSKVFPGNKIQDRDLVIKTLPDYSATVEEILSVRETERIIVIGTSDKLGQNRVEIVKKIVSDRPENIEVEYLLDKNIYDISKVLTGAGNRSIALYLLMFSDGFGEKLTPYEVSEIICRNSNIPVFSFWDVLLGSGITGGNLISFEVIGEEVGEIIFSGNNKNYEEIHPMKRVYDYDALKRWKVDEDRIPPSTRIINKPPDFLVRYRIQVFISILIVIFLTIISFLIYRQLLMKKTNKKIHELYERIREKNRQLNIISELDSLTGLKNRRAIDKIIKNEVERSSRYGNPLTTLLIDIDHFKRVNDNYGHNTGDRVLTEVSEVLRKNTRATDSVSRWGGDEFLIIAANTSLEDAVKLGEKIRERVEKFNFFKIQGVSVSIGISQYRPGETFNKLYERVDEALYLAKEKGRNRVEFKGGVCFSESTPLKAN